MNTLSFNLVQNYVLVTLYFGHIIYMYKLNK